MQLERSIYVEEPDLNCIRPSLLRKCERACRNSLVNYCRPLTYSECVEFIQKPIKLSRAMDVQIDDPKRKTKKKEKPPEETKPKKVEKPKKITKEKPKQEKQQQVPQLPKEKVSNNSCRKRPSEQYLSCCSSCCRHCCAENEKENENEKGEEEEEEEEKEKEKEKEKEEEEEEVEEECARFASSFSCKNDKGDKTSSLNREDEDPCEDLFDLIRESFEEVVKKAFTDVFVRYFACCIDKINKLSCQVGHSEHVLKKFHQDLKFRISYYDRRSTEKMQTLCEMIKKNKQERKNEQCKSKCKTYCGRQNESSSSDNNLLNRRQTVTHLNACNSKCPNVFGCSKNQNQKCGQKRENARCRNPSSQHQKCGPKREKARCKNHSAESSNQSMPSGDEVLIEECDFTEQESRNSQKPKKQENKPKVRQR
ncbi:myb-like protein X [Eupeodes corollae]|uniref:myb-like protein X n=1 Tax=Eupeodes corollae TaxID=290404 RepID=UPI0024923EA6|nr:myb-like protein X [Eupeodes corollae]